jgi:hypothetical protein
MTSISSRFRHFSGALEMKYPVGMAKRMQRAVVKRLIQIVRQAMTR